MSPVSFFSFTLIFTLSLAASSAAGEVTCGWDVAYLPDPDSCTHFFVCTAGVPYRFLCPNKLRWNRVSHVCDYIANTDCSSSGSDPEPITDEPAPPTTTLATTESTRPATQAPETPAPATQAPVTPAPVTQAPETPAPVTQAPETPAPETQAPVTSAPVQPETTEPSKETSPPEVPPPGDSDNLPCIVVSLFFYEPAPGVCNQFYLCRNGVFAGIYSCGKDLHFSRQLQACVVSGKSECSA